MVAGLVTPLSCAGTGVRFMLHRENLDAILLHREIPVNNLFLSALAGSLIVP